MQVMKNVTQIHRKGMEKSGTSGVDHAIPIMIKNISVHSVD